MNNINTLFRQRIGLSENEVLTFDRLEKVLEKTAKNIPFENLSIINNNTTKITEEHLIDHIITKNAGGLCYDLNGMLYLFLMADGFDAFLVRGVIFNHDRQRWNPIGKTHVFILVTYNENRYLVDTGFGGNLPLKPVPLNGEVVASENGEFKIVEEVSEHGDYIFYMKLKQKDHEWKKGYAFDSREVVRNVEDLNEIQSIIVEHPESPFNKGPLITLRTENGNMTLTKTSFTKSIDGKVEKEEIDEKRYAEILKEQFNIHT